MPRGDATILHADADSFFASVEQRDNPRLRGRPVIVGGGVVLAASYEAKAFGIDSAMGGRMARRLCPHAVFVEPRMDAYAAASKAMFEVFHDTTPFVEGLSIDEAFLDVGGLRRIAGTPVEIGERLRRTMRDRVGLAVTVGIARTKFLAKVASGEAKPDGLLLVAPDEERAFLHPLPLERLWGVGPVTAQKLHQRGLITVADVARISESSLAAILGPAAGNHLHALAHNIDPRPVKARRPRRSIGAQRALGRGPHPPDAIEAAVIALADRVGRRLRDAGRATRTVVVRLRFDDFSRATRSHTFAHTTASTTAIADAALALLAADAPLLRERGLTLIGLTAANLDHDGAVQLELPFDHHVDLALDVAVDGVRSRFGTAAITRAVLLGRGNGVEMPVLPD